MTDTRPTVGTGTATVVLDGGLSNALQARGHDLSDQLWTARLLADDPDEIVAVHRTYFASGAHVATTASYQASLPGLMAAGFDRAAAARIITRSVEAADRARDSMPDPEGRWVAASIGPYGAALADGSEYTGRYGVPAAELRDFHGPRLELLAGAGPDLIAVETIPDIDEAEVIVALLHDVGLPAWFSYSIAGDRTRAGQPLADAFQVAASAPQVIAVGVNCCDPADVLPAVGTAVQVTGRPAVAYPNSGEAWDATARAWRGPRTFDPSAVRGWIAAGARLVGGCCRVGPDAIAALAAMVDNETGPTA